MSSDSSSRKSATLTFTQRDQNIKGVHTVVEQILGMAGCPQCGRLALLRFDFGDPPPEALGKLGVVGFDKQGM